MRRVGDDLRPQLLGDQAGEPFAEPHADAADALGAQPDRRGEHQVGAIGLEQVDRADVGLEPLLNEVHDVRERFGGVAALRDQPADLLERPQQRSFPAGFVVASGPAGLSRSTLPDSGLEDHKFVDTYKYQQKCPPSRWASCAG